MEKLAIDGGNPVRKTFLPPFRPTIGEEEIAEVIDTLRSGWITTGPKTKHFEKQFKQYIGCQQAIAVSSCTAALHLSLIVNDIGLGDEVITTPFTFTSTANVIIHQNATPVFVDIESETFNIDSKLIEDKITEKTKAIIPVHYAGHPCEMNKIMDIAADHNLTVIEDAAHAVGATYRGQKIGTIGHLTCFSFYATKNLATAEGGMITCQDDSVANELRILSLHGMSKDAWKRYSSKGSWFYEVVAPGYKYNFTDIQAAMGIHQLKKLESMQRQRKTLAKQYKKALTKIPEVTPQIVSKDVEHAWHLYPILINSSTLNVDRNKVVDALRLENIGTSVHFIPLHLQPFYQQTFQYKPGDFPIAESVYNQVISLPLYPSMDESDVKDVIAALQKIIEHYRK